ncbi:MAG: glycosyltransferase family 9 protein, partial [Chloroflexota bacterium]
PLIDRLELRSKDEDPSAVTGADSVVHDLRMQALGRAMVRNWRQRAPWLYYRDLWFEPRGQWLAGYLGLRTLTDYRPILSTEASDRGVANSMRRPYVLLAPHVGTYPFPLEPFWQRIKGWPPADWARLARLVRNDGREVVTLAAAGQESIPGTVPMVGLPIRHVAGLIERAAGLITVESGLWFIAAAYRTPFVIAPWWLPRTIDWVGPMHVPHRLIGRADLTPETVARNLSEIMTTETANAAAL